MKRLCDVAIIGGLFLALMALAFGAPLFSERRDIACVRIADAMPLFGNCRR